MTDRKRRKTAPWKHIYGTDRRYTARVDRLREREAAKVWADLEVTSGFNEALERAEADLEAGKGVPFREVRR